MLSTTDRMTPTTEAVEPSRMQLILHTYQEILHRLLRSPAVWVFSAVWGLSVLTLVLMGYLEYLPGAFGWLGIALVIGLITVALTARASAIEHTEAPTSSRRWVWAQFAVLLLFMLFLGYRGMLLNHAVGGWLAQLPVVSSLATSTFRLPFLAGNPTLNSLLHSFTRSPQIVASLMLMNPILYVVLPLIALLLLRAHFGELGFGRGYRSWIVMAVVCFLPLVGILVNLVSGQWTLGFLAFNLVSNTLQAGFPEEFLFRGALLTRLSRLCGSEWAVVLSTLLFGLWHFGLAMSATNGNILAAIAYSIVLPGMIGMWFAIIFVRTRNLLAPVVFHALFDVLGVGA